MAMVVPGGRWLDAAMDSLLEPDAKRNLEAVQSVIEKAANELIAIHQAGGIDVYDRVPGLLGVIRLIYPEWADWQSPYYGRYYT